MTIALAAALFLALIGWMRARRGALEAKQRVEDAERGLEEQGARLERERRLAERTARARRTEHEWNRELREQIATMHRERGVLGRTDDLRELVLEVAMRLVDARKGLLLARTDEDADGNLDLVAQRGFANDPTASAVAQHFAGQVIERDKTIRSDHPTAEAARDAAADGEIENLVAVPTYIADRFTGVIVCANRQGGFEELDDGLLLSLGDHAGVVLENGRLHGELRDAYLTTIQMLADALEAKDPFLRSHSDEVCSYVEAVLERLDVDRERREEMIFASLLHDVGKIGISERILLKPGRLTAEERSVIELHPKIGYRLIERVPALRSMAAGILHHHERWDGDGYPAGLRAEEIPLEARVICIADCFSAMTSDRPYRSGMSVEAACEELERCAGTQFDPKVVRLFVEAVRKDDRQRPKSRSLAEALDEPEIAARRKPHEPLLGAEAAGMVDNLTLLYTRRRLHEAADSEAERARIQGTPFAVVFASVDGVEDMNRDNGWAAGDAALCAVARVVDEAATAAGATACRYGGSCFALLVPRVGREVAEPVASDLTRRLAESGHRASVGLAVWSEGLSGDEVIAAASTRRDGGVAFGSAHERSEQ